VDAERRLDPPHDALRPAARSLPTRSSLSGDTAPWRRGVRDLAGWPAPSSAANVVPVNAAAPRPSERTSASTWRADSCRPAGGPGTAA
jgi:hypothetical protein